MAGTAEVITRMDRLPGVHYPGQSYKQHTSALYSRIHVVLVPNTKGLDSLTYVLSANPTLQPPPSDEISIFTAATDAFTKANLNTTVHESLTRLAAVTRSALDQGLRVRGYVSVVVMCPFSGKVDYRRVREVAKELLDMGCYEVSLGDTVGKGTPATIAEMLEEVKKAVPVEKLAVRHPYNELT